MISNIYASIRFVPLVLFLFVAIVGAFVALVGGLAGWGEITETGKLAAGGGALGFFIWLFLPALIRAL